MKTKPEIEEEIRSVEDKYKEYQQLDINYMGNVVELTTKYNTLKWVLEEDNKMKDKKSRHYGRLNDFKMVGLAVFNLVVIGIIFSPYTSDFKILLGLLLILSVDVSYLYITTVLPWKKQVFVTIETKEVDRK